MPGIALPKKYAFLPGQKANALTRRIGIKFDGVERPLDVIAYNVEEGWITIKGGETLRGVVEPYWRTNNVR